MRPAKIILASVTAVIVLTSAALAQQAANGMVTQIDRLSGTMAIQEIQSGTVGASGGRRVPAVQGAGCTIARQLSCRRSGDILDDREQRCEDDHQDAAAVM